MAATRILNIESCAVAWGSGLGFRITKPLAEAAGIGLNTVLSVSAQPGRIVIEVRSCRPAWMRCWPPSTRSATAAKQWCCARCAVRCFDCGNLKLPTPDRSEIVWIQQDSQAGPEMKGTHPMLVLSPKAFVERTGLLLDCR